MFENAVYCIQRIHYVIKEPILFLPVQLLLPSYIHFPFSPHIPRRASLTQQNTYIAVCPQKTKNPTRSIPFFV